MKRDYFTCVFLACIAGALCFVCFEPLYFKYGGIVVREFGLLECIASVLYALFFLLVVPIYSGYKKKYWIAVGLAFYGLLAYLPKMLYPAQVYLSGDDASLIHIIWAVVLRGIYGMVNAPFAALSKLWGDNIASSLSYWILPFAILFPLLIKTYRFYRDAYTAEQLNPASVVAAPSSSKFDRQAAEEEERPQAEPEVLGTVISAPVKERVQKEEQPAIQLPGPKGEPAKELKGRDPQQAIKGRDPQQAIKGREPQQAIKGREPMQALESGAQSRPQIRQPSINPAMLMTDADADDDEDIRKDNGDM